MTENEAREAWSEAVSLAQQVLRQALAIPPAMDQLTVGGLAERVLAVQQYHSEVAAAEAVEEG